MCKKTKQPGRGKKKSAFFSALKCPGSPMRTATLTVASLLVTHSFPIFITQAHAQSSLERLSSLLNATPAGGWVKVSTNPFSDAWPTGADAVPIDSQKFPGQVVSAWSSFAWDSTRGNLLIFGGGHAN